MLSEFLPGLITAENAKDMKTQTGFQRASRTDKGVSAAGNVFSLKIKHSEDAVKRINQCLPPQIKVLGIIKVIAVKDFGDWGVL